jgi:threonine synthase
MEEKLLFYSTNGQTEPVTFSQALLKGLAPDRGLFMPESIPVLTKEEISAFSHMPYYQIAYEVSRRYLKGEIPDADLLQLVKDAYNFDVPLEKVSGNKYIMRLDQGPTASFKDFAARMMGRLMNYYLSIEGKNLLILTATSGDTGSAIANAFFGLNNIKALVLFPESEVTTRQRKQMTTLGQNVQILALDGKFDDCQALVKQAFSDPELDYLNLSSANSINIGRLVPQIVYYFYAFSRLRAGRKDDTILFSVPSGNFGDMMGGIMAMKMGLPVSKFIIATNANDEFPVFLKTGCYEKIEPSLNCISSAMNVGHPSNLARLVALYGGRMDEKGNVPVQPDLEKMRNEIFAVSVDDETTRRTIINTWENHNVLLEPHGAVGWTGLEEFLRQLPEEEAGRQLAVSLETAHPAKFPEEINRLLGIDPTLPASLEGIEQKKENFSKIETNYSAFKSFLINHYK